MEQLPFIERNFHILNDDRFIMEKISLPVEIQDGEDIHAAINRTRETIVQNFKAAYPKVDYRLNFDEIIQNKVFTSSREELPAIITEKTITPTIEEPIDNSFNLIEEINKCSNLNLLKAYAFMCKADDEHAAYSKRKRELVKEEKFKTSNSYKINNYGKSNIDY